MADTRLIDLIGAYKSISIIGTAKNVGKTTVLNHLISEFSSRGVALALSSIGRDGESIDIVTKTAKPRIFIPSGTVFATARSLLGLCDCSKEYLLSTAISSALGEIVIARAISGGYVQLSGPSTNAGLAKLKRQLEAIGDYTLITDGALSRKSAASPALCEACILCTGAALNTSMKQVIEETVFAAELYSLEQTKIPLSGRLMTISGSCSKSFCLETSLDIDALLSCIDKDSELVYVKGAITDKLLNAISSVNMKKRVLAAEDSSKLLISKKAYDGFLARGGKIKLKHVTKLCAICTNPRSPNGFDFDAKEFLEKMSNAVNLTVFDVVAGVQN